ncbi:molecular chaperone [Bradyrhizobium pachyrhizi]|uniref:Molecular chaperone n=1 Tax=Bradyrhizobium pachyrhizi TaxID=280333 RepID=A0A844SSR3_9BRAD|nr:molecular chaperone [Bradyrhizobium pachyrhizi]MVT68475.1 molecular chaperone [Bradyrhizobium pachyrhizi]
MSVRKLPFIQAVKLATIDESEVIPTTLYYDQSRVFIGREAREKCSSPELLIEDFKVELGKLDPDNPTRRSAAAADKSPRRTALGLAKDYFDESLKKLETALALHGLVPPKKILIAEPLSLADTDKATEAWLSNYRRSIRKVLQGKFAEIDFLPEPFAVYQYYRYGCRHPIVSEKRKHVALVLDFGGGTFDVSVVESTKAGEISQSGINARPLAARSIAVGGFYINRVLANDLLHEALEKKQNKSDLTKAINFYNEAKNADDEYLSRLNDQQRAFFRNYKTLLQNVERAKISVCKSIANWDLNADLTKVGAYPIPVPVNPFERDGPIASLRLDASKVRKIYEERIWSQRLKQAVVNTITGAKSELNGQGITIVLLSGGSSNIRWLRPLLERDLRKELPDAQILELSESFQEIVAKGLATECARRFYTDGQGDFRAVTYNRLCLALRPDDSELEIRRFRPTGQAFASTRLEPLEDGVLLPSASSLRGLIGQPLRWKVHLSKPPKRQLDYFFLRSSFVVDDHVALHNVESKRVHTPAKTSFQQNIEVELTIREDGTAEPRFIYSRGFNAPETAVAGRPFYLDMTFAPNESVGETYLGFDFGTSTSAFSYVSSHEITEIEERSQSSGWRELSELVNDLPYVAAAPLARFLSETDQKKRSDRGREAVEGLLTLATYVAYADFCAHSQKTSSHFKGLPHRSAGPLWALLRNLTKVENRNLTFSAPIRDLFDGQNYDQHNQWIDEIAKSKHGKEFKIDFVSLLGHFGNAVAKIFVDWQFGVFEAVTPKRFATNKFHGIFRTLSGASQTFINVLEYEGSQPFADSDVFIVNSKEGTALNLSPLFVWGLNRLSTEEEPELFEFDSEKANQFAFKAIQFRAEQIVGEKSPAHEIWIRLRQMREQDQCSPEIGGLTFQSFTM